MTSPVPVTLPGPLLTPKQVAERLRVSMSTVSKLVSKGKLQAYRIGRCLRISEEALAEYLERAAAVSNSIAGAPAPVVDAAAASGSDRGRRLAEKLRHASATAAATRPAAPGPAPAISARRRRLAERLSPRR